MPEIDVEKWGEGKLAEINVTANTGGEGFPDATNTSSSLNSSNQHDIPPTPVLLKGKLAQWNAKVEGLAGLEARGITRVLPEEKHGGGTHDYLQMFALWFSINLVASSIITGLLGPLVFQLGWVDCVCIVIFANALSSCGASYISTYGPQSGNRTMIIGRYFMGYWPAKLACILNIIMQIGWGIIGCIVAGQMISAVNGGGLSIAVGCVISALCIGFIATFGIAIVHIFERYAFIPQLLVMFVLIGSAGRNFDTSAASVGPAGTITANRCSFFALQVAGIIGYSAIGADFYVYYPTATSKRITFLTTWSGIWLSAIFCNTIGVAIATGVPATPGWNEAYSVSSGALLLACYDGLGGFGGFCVVILALGSITNNAPCSYAAALAAQVLGRYAKAIPRWVWCIVITMIELVCSVAGRNYLFNIFENFLPIMSYWVCPWITIALEEHLLFHVLRGVPFDWTAWEDKRKLPIGAAALFAWLVGWAAAIIGMDQVWYQGPIAVKIGGYGGDIGAWVSIAFACITYPPLRYLELKKFGSTEDLYGIRKDKRSSHDFVLRDSLYTIQAPYDLIRKKSIALIEHENVHTAIAPFIHNARVLDLACGSGFYTYTFLQWGAHAVLGVDISPAMIAEARRLAPHAETSSSPSPTSGSVEFTLADCAIPTRFAGGPFDVVFGAWLLNYAPDHKGLVDMFRNVAINLKDGGHFVSVTVPPAQDPTASVHAELKARPPPEGSGGLVYSVVRDVEDGVYFHVHGDTEVGSVDFDCYDLRKDVYEGAAREAGLEGELRWGVTSVPERYLKGEGLGGACVEELVSYQDVPGFGLLVVAK